MAIRELEVPAAARELGNGEHGYSKIGGCTAVVAGSRWTGARLRRYREGRGLTRSEFGKLFKCEELPNGYSRVYVSRLERGVFPITPRFEKYFRQVREKIRERARAPAGGADGAHMMEVVSDWPLKMKRLEILAKPKKCDGCGRWFVPRQSRQKRHTSPLCQLRARRKREQKEKREWNAGPGRDRGAGARAGRSARGEIERGGRVG
jgi:transcriptional regulator with XRE-family HTH domain